MDNVSGWAQLSEDQYEQWLLNELRARFPALDGEVKCPVCEFYFGLMYVIMHINDNHEWTREAIADWLESLDLDLEARLADGNWEVRGSVGGTPR